MANNIIPPLGGGSGTNSEYLQVDEHCCIIRLQVLIDLLRIRPHVGYPPKPIDLTYYPIHCPVCTQKQLYHTWDYVERTVDGRFFGICCYCDNESEFKDPHDRVFGIASTPQLQLKPDTFVKDNEPE